MRLDTVILPVAGKGTRMLPATKCTPKELLPVYDTPLLHFAVEEALAAGARRIVLVSHPDKDALERWFQPDGALVAELESKGKTALAATVRAAVLPEGVELRIVHQHEQKGLGHAVLCGAEAALPGPVGVILPDDLILGTPALPEMAAQWREGRTRALVAAQHVPLSRVSAYGIFDVSGDASGRCVPADGFVEKPAPADAPSRLAAIGRYVLDDAIFGYLRGTGRGAGGEVQLTDAIAAMGGIHAVRLSGTRYDCGDKDGMVEATLAVQSERRGGSRLRVAAE